MKMIDDTNNINVDKNNNLSGSLLIIIVIFLGMFIGELLKEFLIY